METAILNKEYEGAMGAQAVVISVVGMVVTMVIGVLIVSKILGVITIGDTDPLSGTLTAIETGTEDAFGMLVVLLIVYPALYLLQLFNVL